MIAIRSGVVASLVVLGMGVLVSREALPAAAPETAASPVGLWRTFDDKTGKARGIVRIYEQDGKLFGRLERSFKPGAEKRVCSVCTDDRKDAPMLGLVIIRDLKPADGEFTGGTILDPDNGDVYRCKLRLEAGGTRLLVRGYLGISLFGRSQTWERLDSLPPA